jgi:anti-sigma factor RsiW
LNDEEHDAIASLLGAYALDAVDDDERRLVDEHLDGCDRCRSEVAAHLEVAAALAGTGSAPVGLWDQIVTSIEAGDPPAAVPVPGVGAAAGAAGAVSLAEHRARRRTPRGFAFVAAAAAAVLLVLVVGAGVTIARQDDEIDDIEAALAEAQQDDRMQVAELVTEDGEAAVGAFVSGDRGYLLASDLESLDAGWTYQLWGIRDGQMRSLGLLGDDPSLETFEVQEGVTTLAITREQVPGVEQPTTDPIVAGDLI